MSLVKSILRKISDSNYLDAGLNWEWILPTTLSIYIFSKFGLFTNSIKYNVRVDHVLFLVLLWKKSNDTLSSVHVLVLKKLNSSLIIIT